MILDDIKIEEKIKALGFGRFKVGKTFGAGTFPRPNFMDFDGGVATLVNPDFIKKHGYRKSIMFERFKEANVDPRGIVRVHNAFDDACRYFDACMKPTGSKWKGSNGQVMDVHPDMFDTWVIDSGTTLSQFALNKAIVLLGGPGLGIASKTHAQAINTGLIYPKQQDYGAERSMVKDFIKMVKDSDKNVLVLCHEREITDDNGNLKAVVPLLTGKGVEEIPIMFDEVWNIQRRPVGTEVVIQIITQQTSTLKVGSRLGVPNQTPFEYSAIRRALDANNEARTAAKQSASTAAVAARN